MENLELFALRCGTGGLRIQEFGQVEEFSRQVKDSRLDAVS